MCHCNIWRTSFPESLLGQRREARVALCAAATAHGDWPDFTAPTATCLQGFLQQWLYEVESMDRGLGHSSPACNTAPPIQASNISKLKIELILRPSLKSEGPAKSLKRSPQ
eukprot:scaffold676859_cov33-Prasinocladus_malaysianus.AAC.1